VKVLGFTGFFGAGKGTAINLVLQLTGASVFSTSEEVSLECLARGLTTDRQNKITVANEVRSKLGPGEFARRVVEKIRKLPPGTRLALVDALRTAGEVQVLQDAFGKDFTLISIDAPVELRYKRNFARNRDAGDALTFEQFVQMEARENKPDAKPFEQSLGVVGKMAEYHVDNAGTLEGLKEKLQELLKKIG
jgi:dephospho-CoA kinase